MRPARLIPFVLLSLAACTVHGELGNLGFNLKLVDPIVEFESGDRILLGSHFCPDIGQAFSADGSVVFHGTGQRAAARACFDETVEGPAQLDADRCFVFEEPGEVSWSLTPTGDCEYLGDRLRFTIVEVSPELRLGFDDWRARVPEQVGGAVIGLAPGRSSADLREDPSAARLVLADQLDVPQLRLDDLEGRVFWTPSEVSLSLVGEGVTAVEPIDDPEAGIIESQGPGELPLRLELGGVARARATLPGGQVLESPELIGVSSTTVAELDLVALVDAETGAPLYAFAEIRDAEGRVLHGAPIEWGVQEGALSVYSGSLETDTRTSDYASLGSNCEPPAAVPVQHRAVLRARLGALEDTVELVWWEEAADPETLAKPFSPDEDCLFGDGGVVDSETGADEPGAEIEDGCGCTSGGRATPFSWLLALLGLVGLRRRRHAC